MSEYEMQAVLPADVRRRLKVPAPVFQSLVRSGLLGQRTVEGWLLQPAIEHYERYGTQWITKDRPDLAKRMVSAERIQSMPPPPDVGDEKTPGVQTKFYVSAADGPDLEKALQTDTGWLAQFYLTPNPYMWPAPTSMGMISSTLLKLSRARTVPVAELPLCLYPDPAGFLAMVMVKGYNQPHKKAFEIAYDVAGPILDELSVKYDQPLPISHSLIVGIPSGMVITQFPQIPEVCTIEPGETVFPSSPYSELRDAASLYREGVSSNNPFHQFLALWKAYENACEARGNWRKRYKLPVSKVRDEVFPTAFGFRGYEGFTFDQVKQKLERPYRVALAHGWKVREGKPKTAASAKDFFSVSYVVPIVRYMAQVTIRNVRETLVSTEDSSVS